MTEPVIAGYYDTQAYRGVSRHMKEAGEALRRARLAQGLSLDQVAAATRIRKSYLQSLEDGNLAGLPHPFYARNFARVYATYVGLDAEEIAAVFPGTQPPRVPAKLKVIQPSSDPWGFILGAVALLSVVLLGIYGYSRLAPLTALESVPPLLSAGPAPTETPTLAPAPTETATRTPTPSYVGIAEVRILTTAPSWLYVLIDNKNEFSATLDTGTTKTFTGKESVYMIAGNAGAVEVTYNGQQMGALGKKSEVARMIWTPKDGAQTPTPAPPTRTPTVTPRPAIPTQTPAPTRTPVPTGTPVPAVAEEHTSTPSPNSSPSRSTDSPPPSATAKPAQ
ncbi:MAG: helix-turn-helix domain-containing protein [Chloroflexota bacterium]|nr:MAG: helix-turn-helix domain-containing protein [Chloroflexota bacterium]